jgi:hypothetical protein
MRIENLIQQIGVVQHLQMRLENVRLLGTQVFGDSVLNFENLEPGLDEGFFEAVNFRRHVRLGNFMADDDMPGAVQNENFPATNACRNGNAAKRFFSLWLSRHK